MGSSADANPATMALVWCLRPAGGDRATPGRTGCESMSWNTTGQSWWMFGERLDRLRSAFGPLTSWTHTAGAPRAGRNGRGRTCAVARPSARRHPGSVDAGGGPTGTLGAMDAACESDDAGATVTGTCRPPPGPRPHRRRARRGRGHPRPPPQPPRAGPVRGDVERALLLQVVPGPPQAPAHRGPPCAGRAGGERRGHRRRRRDRRGHPHREPQPPLGHRALPGGGHRGRRHPPGHLHHGGPARRGDGPAVLRGSRARPASSG